MPKTLREAKIAGRTERRRLQIGVHWRGIDPDVHLGYRKGKHGGAWLVRWYLGKAYRQKTLGTADDELTEGTLDYNAAVKEARALVEAERRRERAAAEGPALTVRHAVEIYSTARDTRDTKHRGRQTRSDATSRLSRYVTGQAARGQRQELPPAPLADVALHNLTESDLLNWRAALPASLKSTSKRRLVNDLKAALNAANTANRARLPTTFTATVKHGLSSASDAGRSESVARDNQILTDAQVGRLIGAARQVDAAEGFDGDLFRLVVVLAATGARFSQVARLRVADFQAKAGRLIIPVSRKGHGEKEKARGTPVPIGSDVIEALLPCTVGRPGDAPLLERWRSKQVAGSIKWERVGRGPWQSASELVRPWAKVRQVAELPEVIPYALRHSSIVRGIGANLPIRLVAALHDTSVTMIERHYGRYIADGLDELAARSVVPLVPAVPRDNVVRLAL